MTAEPTTPTASELLSGPATPVEDSPRGPVWWRRFALIVVSLFVAYHTMVLLAWNLPHKHGGKDFYRQFAKWTQASRYFRGTGNTQSWAMFAPNPNRTNAFVRVLVIDENDEVWDMDHDIYGKERYPYLWYDRMGKVNRRIDGKKGYQRAYGAYVCRMWERDHGHLPKEVRFVRRSTRIPSPWNRDVRDGPLGLSYEPWELHTRQSEQERIRCKSVKHGQLSPELRERFGMPPAEDGHFKGVKISTWWKKQERVRRKEEREAARKAREEKNREAREAGEGKGLSPEALQRRRKAAEAEAKRGAAPPSTTAREDGVTPSDNDTDGRPPRAETDSAIGAGAGQ